MTTAMENRSMRLNSWHRAVARCVPMVIVMATAGFTGCKSLNERYLAMEVWKYEKCFGHLPPGFVPPGAMAAAPSAAMRPCAAPAPCQAAPCGQGGEQVVGTGGNCNQCQGGGFEGGMPSGHGMSPGMPSGPVMSPGLPAGPGGSPGPSAGMPTPAAITSSRPVVISDEVVLP